MKNVLSIGGFYHDLNAAIYADGRFYLFEEERFSRIKHHPLLGARETTLACVDKCLEAAGLTLDDIDAVVMSDAVDNAAKAYVKSKFAHLPVTDVPHHLCHAACGFYTQPDDTASVLVLDAFGDNKSGGLYIGNGSTLEPFEEFSLDNSIGILFLQATYHIGLGKFGSEGKTQGLASYGQPAFFEEFKNLISVDNGKLKIDPKLFGEYDFQHGELYAGQALFYNSYFEQLFTRRLKDDKIEQVHMDFARSIQDVLNDVSVNLLKSASAQLRAADAGATAPRNIFSGGCAQNSTTNDYITERLGNCYVPPSASDRGNSLGALLYFLNHIEGASIRIDHPVFSPISYSMYDEAKNRPGLKVHKITPEQRTDIFCEKIENGDIVVRCIGGSELGARALGNRSICANPRTEGMRDFINDKVKHREWFRPFAPSIIADSHEQMFDRAGDTFYMTQTVPVKARDKIKEAVHVDGTARVQIVSDQTNPAFYHDLKKLEQSDGIGCVINTSFNDNGEPIVESPKDALNSFAKMDVKYMLGDDCFVEKAE